MSIKWAFVQTDWDQIIKPNQNIMQYIRRLKDFWKTSKKISNAMQLFSEFKKQNKKVSKKFMARTGTGLYIFIFISIALICSILYKKVQFPLTQYWIFLPRQDQSNRGLLTIEQSSDMLLWHTRDIINTIL